jgi:hypothetical protein
VLFAPGLVSTLYRVDASGPLGVLVVHRGALFLAIVVACGYALLEPGARRLAVLIAAISMIGYLAVYLRSGAPVSLRTVAVDGCGRSRAARLGGVRGLAASAA